jgi:hypothetical protein
MARPEARARCVRGFLANPGGIDMTVVGRLLGTAAAVLLLASAGAYAQEKQDKKPAAKPAAASPCKGLDDAGCKGNSECQWITPKKGKQKPYCKLKAKAKKAAAPKKDAPTK